MTNTVHPVLPDTRTGAFNKDKERFAVFLRNTDQKEVQLKATLTGLERLAPDTWKVLSNPASAFHVTSIGAGSGGLEIPLVKAFIERRGSPQGLWLLCEDVSPTMRDEFMRNAEKAAIKDILKEYQVIAFENPNYTPMLAHFTVSSHVWYYIQNWRNTPKSNNSLTKFQSTLATDGIGLYYFIRGK